MSARREALGERRDPLDAFDRRHVGAGVEPHTWTLKPSARRATSCPMRPRPMISSVLPRRSEPRSASSQPPPATMSRRLAQAARGHEDQPQREIGDRVAQHRRVRHGDAAACGRVYVDVVEANADRADHAELRCVLEECGAGGHVRVDEETFGVAQHAGEVDGRDGREVDHA